MTSNASTVAPMTARSVSRRTHGATSAVMAIFTGLATHSAVGQSIPTDMSTTSLPAGIIAQPAPNSEFTWSKQLSQIGLTSQLQDDAGQGKGITVGIIDTGIAASQIDLSGHVDPRSTCFGYACASKGSADDNQGHGTHVAGIIGAAKNGIGTVGIAPSSNLLALKALNAAGTGTTADAASAIRYAADAGAKVLNLSMTFAFDTNMVSAINYAASKNATIVLAGGNLAGVFNGGTNVTGFTDQAVSRMLYVGAVDPTNAISWYSNRPGAGAFISTTGHKTPFSNLWLVAPGDNILSTSNYADPTDSAAMAAGKPAPLHYYQYLTGTSMSAPEVSGAAALMLGRWSYLAKLGTVGAIITQQAQDLGTAGNDAVYGSGLLRIDRLFLPIGTLVLYNANGSPVATGTVGTNGALGNLGALAKQLKSVALLDSYQRDFAVDLSGNVQVKPSTSSTATANAQPAIASAKSLYFAFNGSPASLSLVADATGNYGYGTRIGNTLLAFGESMNGAALSFTQAQYGQPTGFSGSDYAASGSLLALAGGGHFATVSTPAMSLGSGRLTMSLATTKKKSDTDVPVDTKAIGSAMALGISFSGSFGQAGLPTFDGIVRGWNWSLGMTGLSENGLLLGTNSSDALALSSATRSFGMSAGTAIDLDHGFSLAVDAMSARVHAVAADNSLLTPRGDLQAFAFGVALSKTGVAGEEDRAVFAVRKPLRVYSGATTLTVPTGMNDDGNLMFDRRKISLVPDGNETDVQVGYSTSFMPGVYSDTQITARLDADQVKGAHDVGLMQRFRVEF